ncbi:TIGR03086 family metal-binding protein [Nocardiopsis sediminis]|uniref:TIGR03086 family metal-binding protein n=1 Tax=Nocardiopsis sediminis TaxID=1778267 RepID=A0ABV8FS22_9ACTN
MSELLDLHGQAMQEFDRRVHAIRPGQWPDPTPCISWDVRDLVDHIVGEQLWVPYLLSGGRIEDAGDDFADDPLGEDPISAWEVSARDARAAWLRPGATERTVHLSFGDVPGSVYLWQMTFDLAVHAWDLGRGIGEDETLDTRLSETLLDWWQDQGISGGPMFADPVPVGETADAQSRLLASTGRRP